MRTENKTEIDVIILSYAYNDELKQTTIDGINSLIASENPSEIKFNVIVIESSKELGDYQYPHTITIYPEQPFGYHRYMNIGIKLTTSPYVCLCNNDLIFHKGWASEILKYMDHFPDLVSASPMCSFVQNKLDIPLDAGILPGYRIGYEIAGWCLFLKRSVFQIIGELDENFLFNFADYDYSNTLAMLNLKHALITSSIVDHLNNTTLKTQNQERQEELKSLNFYHYKWLHRVLPS